MEASVGREKARRRRRRRTNTAASMAVLLMWVILISAQFDLPSALHHPYQQSVHQSPSKPHSRKAGFFDKARPPTSSALSESPRQEEEENEERVYEDDKRLVHTGPNPLHN